MFSVAASVCGGYTIHLALYNDVKNCSSLKQLAIDGSLKVALIQPRLVLDTFQVLCAANKALHNHVIGKQVTKTLQSEILYCLSPTKNISDAFRRFGINEKSTDLLLVEISKDGESQMAEVCKQVDGDPMELTSLKDISSEVDIKKVYKIKELELTVGTLVEAVVARMASKDFITH